MNAKMSMGSLTKIVNIIFLIVLQNFVLDGAMGFFAIPLLLYYVVYTLFFNSLQSGISKMVSIRNSKGINGNSKRIVKPALGYVLAAGLLLAFIAYFILRAASVSLFKVTYPVPTIMLFCIILIINGIIDVLCGYHSGNGNEGVVVIVNVLKMILPMILSFFVIRIFKEYGNKIAALLNNEVVVDAYIAMGIACIYLCTAILIAIVLLILTIYTRKYTKAEKTVRGIDSRRSVVGGFASINLRIMMNKIFTVLSLVFVVMAYLQSVIKSELPIEVAYSNIGILFTRVLLPILLVLLVFGEYVSKEKHRLHIDYRRDETKTMVVRAQYMIKNAFFMLIPPTMIMVFLAGSLAKALFKGQSVLATTYIKTGGSLLLMAGIALALAGIVSAYDREKTVWLVHGISFVSQVIFVLTGFAKNNGDSMLILYSFYLCFGIRICLLFVLAYSVARMDLLDILLKLGKYGVAGIIMMVLYMILERFVTMNLILVFLSFFLGYLLYYLTLLALHGISKKDEAALKRTLNYYPVHFLRSRLRL